VQGGGQANAIHDKFHPFPDGVRESDEKIRIFPIAADLDTLHVEQKQRSLWQAFI
jgi:hypothetical protein